jgi:Protein of unknown function (DUF2798)
MNLLLPSRAAPYAFAAIQALVTTGVSTLIGVWSTGGFSVVPWLAAWAEAWTLLLPLVLLLAPFIRRMIEAVSRD